VSDRPSFRRSALAKFLLVWMALALLVVLTYGLWLPALPFEAMGPSFLLVYLVAPAILLLWSLWALVQAPRTAWPGPLVLMAFCAAFVLGAQPLSVAGAWVGLATHRAAYDRMVREAQAGRLDWRVDGGKHDGIRYGFVDGPKKVLVFPWDHDPYGGWIGVVHDEQDCPPRPPPPPPPQVPGVPPFIKNAGRFDQRFHVSGHYCLSVFTGM
jgi:hypothetical protein